MAGTSGMNDVPRGKRRPVVKPGEFKVGVVGLDHGHIAAMCYGLQDAGAQIVSVYDPDPARTAWFTGLFPGAEPASSLEILLDDPSVHMVASAIIPNQRGALGLNVQAAGKHYFSDKAPFTTLAQLKDARRSVATTGKKWAVCYGERLQSEAAVLADELIADGEIGRIINVTAIGPHRLQAQDRPEWFFHKETYGGILVDLGSHQIEQFLYYAGARDASISSARAVNYNHPQYPDMDDYGDVTLMADNGVTGYFRVDWFTPDGLSSWGDGRTFVVGTNGYIEFRKYVDVARQTEGEHLYVVTDRREEHIQISGRYGFPYFGKLILDCLNGTETAMSQEHAFKAAELCILAQQMAVGPSKTM